MGIREGSHFCVSQSLLDLKRSVSQNPSRRRVLQRSRPEPDFREAKASPVCRKHEMGIREGSHFCVSQSLLDLKSRGRRTPRATASEAGPVRRRALPLKRRRTSPVCRIISVSLISCLLGEEHILQCLEEDFACGSEVLMLSPDYMHGCGQLRH